MPLLDTFEAAVRTKLARATLAKLRVSGGGPPFTKLGAKVVYEEADVMAWVADKGKRLSTARVIGRPPVGPRGPDAPRAA